MLGSLAAALLRTLDPETAHRLAVRGLAAELVPNFGGAVDARLGIRLFGLDFPHPVGIAAGFDKSAEAWGGLLRLGAGFVEVGTITPRPQAGNPRPRLFRLSEDAAAINRYGFNNDGLDASLGRLDGRDRRRGIVGINVGANKDTADPASDYAVAVRRAAPLADYLVINVSSPNTPGLRDLQAGAALRRLLAGALAARAEAGVSPPLLVKIAPDLDDGPLADVVGVSLEAGVDGLIVSNTTLARPAGLRARQAGEAGGLSGRPLFELSTRVTAKTFRLVAGRVPVIGAGGIEDGATAYAKIRAGASLVQLYTALVYRGPGLFRSIAGDIAARLAADGHARVADAVGLDAARWAG